MVDTTDREGCTRRPVRVLSVSTEGYLGERPAALYDWIADQDPAVVLWQGLHHDDVVEAEKRLNMDIYTGGPPGLDSELAILLAGEGPLMLEDFPRPSGRPAGQWPAYTVVGLADDGGSARRELCLFSVRACPWDSAIRVSEARWLTRWSHPGMLTLAAGVWHDVPRGTEVPWSLSGGDSALWVQRTYPSMCGHGRHTDDLADRELTAAGYVDAARCAVDRHGRAHLALAPTSSYGPGRRLTMREVRAYVTAELAPAIARVEVASPTEMGCPLVHLPLIVDLDADELRTIMSRDPGMTGP